MTVEVDVPDSNMTHAFHITTDNIAKMQKIDIPNVWGHVNLVANGAGQVKKGKALLDYAWLCCASPSISSFLDLLFQAVAQLDVNWGVDYEPFKDKPARDCFNLTIQVSHDKTIVNHFLFYTSLLFTSLSRNTSTAATSPRLPSNLALHGL